MKIRLRQRQLARQRQLPASDHHGAGSLGDTQRHDIAPAATPAFEDGLAQQCREKWRRGDWEGLLSLSLDDVERHPQRARLALMIASAHQAQGDHAHTRTLTGLAMQWGCSGHLVARVLLAGIHNTLGRAAVASGKLRDRALHHFDQAVAPGGPRGARRLALHQRVQSQLSQLQMTAETGRLLDGNRTSAMPAPPLVATPLRELHDGLRQQGEMLLAQIVDQQRRMDRMHKQIEQTVTREALNAVRQIEAHSRIERYLGSELVPALHGWPISADFGVLLLDLVERNDYDLIIEFGSGSSTVLMATAVKRLATKRAQAGRPPTHLLALEHLEEYHQQTHAMLAAADLTNTVQLALAPLQAVTLVDGRIFQYYDARKAISEAVASLPHPPGDLRVLLMVDGPPATTGPRARYPAVPLTLEFLFGARIDVLLDDYRREDEQRVAEAWMVDLQGRGLTPKLTAYSLEKDACLISV